MQEGQVAEAEEEQESVESLLRQSVCYWRMTRPQFDDHIDSAFSNHEGFLSEDEEDYDVLYASAGSAKRILSSSEYFAKFMPRATAWSDALLAICSTWLVQIVPTIMEALIRRFTEVRFNWETKTLQSFMEVTCWLSVTYAAYTIYQDWLWAVQLGTFVGALMSVCDEIVLQLVRGSARLIRNQPGGSDVLGRLGFDIPKNGKAPTTGQEVSPIKNLMFGYLGVVAMRSVWDHFHDVKYFALLAATMGVVFVAVGELFCLWLPTRRIGLTLQQRWTKIPENWQLHFARSLMELLCWTGATAYFYITSQCFYHAFRLGTLIGVVVCLASGLEELPNVLSQEDLNTTSEYSFWQDHAAGDPFLALSEGIIKVQNTVVAFGREFEREALAMYENWGE